MGWRVREVAITREDLEAAFLGIEGRPEEEDVANEDRISALLPCTAGGSESGEGKSIGCVEDAVDEVGVHLMVDWRHRELEDCGGVDTGEGVIVWSVGGGIVREEGAGKEVLCAAARGRKARRGARGGVNLHRRGRTIWVESEAWDSSGRLYFDFTVWYQRDRTRTSSGGGYSHKPPTPRTPRDVWRTGERYSGVM